MSIEVSAAIMAICFIIFDIFVILVILALVKTLLEVNRTLIQTKKQIDDLKGQTSKIMDHTNHVTFDVKRKMEALDPIFNALSNIGGFLEQKTLSLKRRSAEKEIKVSPIEMSFEEEAAREPSKAADIIQLIDVVLRLWQKIKKRS